MKRISCFLIIALVALCSRQINGQSCAAASSIYSFTYEGKSYEVIKEMKTWANAAACAVERGGYLVQIGDQNEQTAVWDAVINGAAVPVNYVSVGDGGGIAYVWIGATDKFTEGTWLWDGNNDGNGINFWTGQGANGTGNGTAVGGLYNNWGGTSTGAPKEPDDYASNQDAAAIGLRGWPSGSGTLGIAGEWNDISLTNSLYFIVEKEGTGLLEPGENPIRFTPNPVTDKLVVHSDFSGTGMAEITILDANGKVVGSKKHLTGAEMTLDLSSLANGFYIVLVTTDDHRRFYHKIVVKR